MKNILIVLFANIVPIGFLLIAALLIIQKMDGYGWCLLCAVLTVSTITLEKKEKENE